MNIKPLALHVLCGVCLVAPVAAQTADTVRAYDRASVRAYYDGRGLVRQVQRFHVPAGTTISSIGLVLRGEPTKAAGNIVIYGHEGGLVAPRLGKELYRTTFSKERYGNEEVRVAVDPVFTHAGGQLFVSFEGLAAGIDVLTDTRQRPAPCAEAWGEGRYDQMQLDKEGKWKQTPLAYCVDLAVNYPASTSGQFVRDTTFDDVADKLKDATKYLSLADVDMNGYVDVASAGILQLRDEHGGVEIDMQRTDQAPYVFFADVDGDHRADVLSMETSNATRIDVLRLGADRRFKTSQSIALPQRLTIRSMSIGDVNDDGYSDVIMSGTADTTASMMAILSTVSGPKAEVLTLPATVTPHNNATLLCADLHASTAAEILMRTPNHDYILRYTGAGTTTLVAEREHTGIGSSVGSAGVVFPSEDGTVQLILPSQKPWSVSQDNQMPLMKHDLAVKNATVADGDAVRYEERISAEHRADVDNDGVDEIIRFAGGTCRRIGVFKHASGVWTDITSTLGLDSLDDCDDGVLTDMNKDGRVDLVVVRRQRLEVYMNRMAIPVATTIALEEYPVNAEIRASDGTVIQRVFVPSGYGHLFQSPAQAHVVHNVLTAGGATRAADSIAVHWSGNAGSVESFAVSGITTTATAASSSPWQVATRATGHNTTAATIAGEAAAATGMKQDAGDVVINTSQTLVAATLSVYDIAGNRIGEASLGNLAQGAHRFTLAALLSNSTIASGTYRAVLTSKTQTTTCPIAIVR
ncbi:MAG: VCBS repeat-containing protein [Bacteroidetes bacterium]|nr:VCBS repeat-containing protein [Bacteroidota bacterium]